MTSDATLSLTTPSADDGWQPGAPPHVTSAARWIDRDACREAECAACGHVGLDYRPEHLGRRYRAVAVCPVCGHAQEF